MLRKRRVVRQTTVDSRRERGQVLILWILAATVVFVIGAIVVDFGVWWTERRGAQKDADAATLAAAFELLSQDFVDPASNNFGAIQSAAEQAAYDWAALNGVPPEKVHDLVVADTDCLGPSPVIDTVSLAAEHDAAALFTSIFGVYSLEIGAPAKACLGSITTAEGLLPVGVQIAGVDSDCWADIDLDGEEDPLFGQECTLTFGAGEQVSGEAGNLRLFNDGSTDCSGKSTGGNKTYLEEIASGGANTECHVYKYIDDPSMSCADDPGGCVSSLTGVGSKPEMGAFNTLLSTEGECDSEYGDGDGIDEFLEVVEAVNGDPSPSPDTLFTLRPCDSPRYVALIILQQFDDKGNAPTPIVAFASFYLKGCEVEDQGGEVQYSDKCDPKDFQGQIGQVQLRGHFLNILTTAGSVGHISKWSPKRIILVE